LARFEPHFGQAMATFSSRLRKNTSKLSLHLPHWYSKIGMVSFLGRVGPRALRVQVGSGRPLFRSKFIVETGENVKANRRDVPLRGDLAASGFNEEMPRLSPRGG
jgi:hypothetical protein